MRQLILWTMKKLILFALMAVSVLAASAQENAEDSTKAEPKVYDMNRTFSVGGKALLCLRSASADKKDLKALLWTLSNDRIGESNVVKLVVTDRKTEEIIAHQIWTDGVDVTLTITDKGTKMYEVKDELFSHLRIVELGKEVYGILFYSEMLK